MGAKSLRYFATILAIFSLLSAVKLARLARGVHCRIVNRAASDGWCFRPLRLRRFSADGLQAVNNYAQVASSAFAFQYNRKAVERGLDGELGGGDSLFLSDWRDV